MCPSISDSVPEVWKLIRKCEHSLKKRLSIGFRWKLELFQKYGIRVWNHGVGQVDNENENQSRYSNMSNTYIGRSLIYRMESRALSQGYQKCEEETQECDVT